MPPVTIDVFSEGATEKGVIEKLCSRGICPHTLAELGGGGEQEMLRKLGVRLRAWFELAEEQREPLRILVMRDLDSHQGRTVDRLGESVLNIVQRHRRESSLVSHPNHDNLFALRAELSGLRLALHVANRPYRRDFIKSTIDDYVLNLSLRRHTAQALLHECRRDDWALTAERLVSKVQNEIPALLAGNGIPRLIEAKEYVRLYAAVLQIATTPAVFAAKVLSHAAENEIREVFASLLAAIQLLAEDSAPA